MHKTKKRKVADVGKEDRDVDEVRIEVGSSREMVVRPVNHLSVAVVRQMAHRILLPPSKRDRAILWCSYAGLIFLCLFLVWRSETSYAFPGCALKMRLFGHACPGINSYLYCIDDKSLKVRTRSSPHVGNLLSIYWQGRGLAYLGGLSFTSARFSSDFVQYLPQNVARSSTRNESMLDNACSSCDTWWRWQFAHQCLGAWTEIRETIQRDTRIALKKAGYGYIESGFRAGDVVIHDRCAVGDTFMASDMYGEPAFSFYSRIPEDTKRIFITVNPAGVNSVCDNVREGYMAYITKRLENVEFQIVSGDFQIDFARLTFAPVVFRSVSSYSLWAALANTGDVYSPENPMAWGWTSHDFGSRWHWVDTPLFLISTAREAGVSTREDVLNWFETH